jgi:NACalpha-BTF3-like transcription factor
MADTSRMQKEAAQLDSVTDRVTQRELESADTSKIQVAMKNLAAQQLAAKQEAMKIESELSRVKVSDEDVKIVSQEFDMTRQKAERLLKECKGDLQQCVRDFIQKDTY